MQHSEICLILRPFRAIADQQGRAPERSKTKSQLAPELTPETGSHNGGQSTRNRHDDESQ